MNKLKRILNESSGASLVFVLCAAVLLLAIGTSVLVAASTSTGVDVGKRTYNQINLYADSIIKSFTYCLQAEEDDIGSPEFLGISLMKAVYESREEFDPERPLPTDLVFEMKFEGDDLLPEIFLTESPKLEIKFENIFVDITPYAEEEPAVTLDDGTIIFDEIPEQPRRAEVSFTMRASLKLEVGGQSATEVATYRFEGGVFENEEDDDHEKMVIKEAGEWRLLSYEKVDN